MFHHVTVLKNEAVDGLNVKQDGIYVDCTMGGAGHSLAIAARLSSRGLLIAIDQDDAALDNAKPKLAPYMDRVRMVKSNFRDLDQVLRGLDIPATDGEPLVDGVLFDLGVSSPQLDEADRGFSYNQDAPLDMRMNREHSLTAEIVVNEWEQREISRILANYGEEKFAGRIASHIVKARASQPIATTGQLAEIIKSAIPAAARRSGPHPAKRSFQAIRIAVNDELGALEDALEQAVNVTASGGRIAVISFHSLEDRLCKRLFAKFVEKCTCPPDFPVCVCQKKGKLRIVTKKPITPSEQELHINPRARSAKLRIAERI